MGAGPQGVVYFCPEGGGERGRDREREGPTELDGQLKGGEQGSAGLEK